MKKIALSFLWLVVVPIVLMAHDFYISTTLIQHHPKTQKLSIRVKIFVNDFEATILQEQGVRLDLGTNTPLENTRDYIEQYLRSSIFISINGSPILLDYINHKVELAEFIEDNVIICQLESCGITEIKTIKVHNSLLTEAFDRQVNIVYIRANNTKKIVNLDKSLPEEQVIF